jgi:hypothetical protein
MGERAYDPSFGSIAVVRRAGLDLRNNVKFMSFGHIKVLCVEVMQVLEEAFRIFESEDVRDLFGANTGWDVVEEILVRYFNESLATSPRQRMAVTGRDILRWLAQPFHPQLAARTVRDAVARHRRAGRGMADERAGHGLAVRTGTDRISPFGQPSVAAVSGRVPAARRTWRRTANGRRPVPVR